MGYSIMVEFPNTKIRDKVLAFLIDNMTPINELVGEEYLYTRGPVEDPAYGRDKAKNLLIGFDFTLSGNIQSRIAYMICYWMIQKIPDSKFWYDGIDNWSIPEDCDEHGFRSLAAMEENIIKQDNSRMSKLVYTPLIQSFNTFNKPVHDELKRLSKIWEQIK